MALNVIKKTLKKIYQFKMTLLFLAFWAHVSILNLFYFNYSGPVFLLEENSAPLTIQVHFLIALLSTLFYFFVSKVRIANELKKSKITDNMWFISCIILIMLILSVLTL